MGQGGSGILGSRVVCVVGERAGEGVAGGGRGGSSHTISGDGLQHDCIAGTPAAVAGLILKRCPVFEFII